MKFPPAHHEREGLAYRVGSRDTIKSMATTPITERSNYAISRARASYSNRGLVKAPARLLDEAHFVHLLGLERKKTQRSGTPFMLILLDGKTPFSGLNQERIVSRISSAISGCTRETDTIGWHQDGA